MVVGLLGMYATGTLWRDDLLLDAVAVAAAPGRASPGNTSGRPGGRRQRVAPARLRRRGGPGDAEAGPSDESGSEGDESAAWDDEAGGSALLEAPPPQGRPPPFQPASYFFQRPRFERLTFTKHLLSNLAAVAAWTGLWDLLDQSVLPALSDSCVLRIGLLADYPCVLVKFGLVALGAAGLHATGALYTMEEAGGAWEAGGHKPGRGLFGSLLGPLPWRAALAALRGGQRRAAPPGLLAAAAAALRARRRRTKGVALSVLRRGRGAAARGEKGEEP